MRLPIVLRKLEEGADQEAHLQEPRTCEPDISDYIEGFYNRARRHSHLGGVSPDEFEVAARRRRDRVH